MKKYKKPAKIYGFTNKPLDFMQNIAENLLNPKRYHLSTEAKKRLKWMYIIQSECHNKISVAARKIGVSRQWLSLIHSRWKKNKYDSRFLEPESKAPKNTSKRNRIDKDIEKKIVEIRNKYHWGKDKIATVLERDYQITVGATTVNRYLAKKGLLDIKISQKNKMAYKNKIELKQKTRPPKKIKDYQPGALIEKDMKFIIKMGQFTNPNKHKAKENFWLQHTFIDSFTRLRALELTEDGSSESATKAYQKAKNKLPFKMACFNTDNGSENEKDFADCLEQENIVHFYSRSGTPTDNPRVERSHLTDDLEFYNHGGICKTFTEQQQKLSEHEHTYNYIRPHQALGNLTPMEFYELWKQNPVKAHAISGKWTAHLIKQRNRLANARKIKSKEKIERLMEQIDLKLTSDSNS